MPAYRGLAYVVFDTLNCARWGNRLPSFAFEIVNVVPYSQIILNTANLQVYYRFNTAVGTLVDSGPNGFNQSLESGSLTTTIVGRYDQAIGNTPVQLGSVVGNNALLSATAISIEGWFQWKGGAVVNGESEFNYSEDSTGRSGWEWVISPDIFTATTHLLFQHIDAINNLTVFTFTVARDTFWHQCVITYDQAGFATLYYDGVQQQQVAAPVTLAFSPGATSEISVEINDYFLDELAFYNRILTPLEVQAHYQGKGSTTGTALASVFGQCGLSASQYDVSQATDYLDGFLIHTRQDARTAIQELLRLYQLDLAEYDGVLHAVKRGGAPLLTVPVSDTGAHVTTGAETDPPKKVEVKRLPELEVPFRVDLRYYDRDNLYQLGLQGATRFTKTEIQEPLTIHTTLVLHHDDARQKAETELYRQWVERQQLVVSLGPAYTQLVATDVFNLPVGATTVRSRVVALDMGLLGPIAITAVQDDATILGQTAVGQTLTPTTDLVTAQTTTLIAWNGNALRDADAVTVGLYVAAASPAGSTWEGATLYWSRDAGASYQQLDTLANTTTYGTANNALPDWAGGDIWDTTNHVDVLLVSGTAPQSTSDADVLAGNNAALLANEIIQYATVTPQGGGVYRLTRLLRGRRGTEPHQSEHQVGDRFAFLASKAVLRENLTNDLRYKSVLLKAVTGGQTLATTTAVPVWMDGDELKCYSPVQLAVSRDGSQNITFTWVRRTRIGGELRDMSDVPLSETTEAYTAIVVGFGFQSAAITGITQDPVNAVVTAPGHGWNNGQVILLTGILGMWQANGLVVTVGNRTTNTFTIGLASSGWDTYVSGGVAEQVIRQINVTSQTASYLSSQQNADSGANYNPVRWTVGQIGAFGVGYLAPIASQ